MLKQTEIDALVSMSDALNKSLIRVRKNAAKLALETDAWIKGLEMKEKSVKIGRRVLNAVEDSVARTWLEANRLLVKRMVEVEEAKADLEIARQQLQETAAECQELNAYLIEKGLLNNEPQQIKKEITDLISTKLKEWWP